MSEPAPSPSAKREPYFRSAPPLRPRALYLDRERRSWYRHPLAYLIPLATLLFLLWLLAAGGVFL